jgi:tRNA 2-thiouridine synthesizing protein B
MMTTAFGYMRDGDKVILIEDAVYAALDATMTAQCRVESISFLQSDLEARGIAKLVSNDIQVIDYYDFVELTVQNPTSVTWA